MIKGLWQECHSPSHSKERKMSNLCSNQLCFVSKRKEPLKRLLYSFQRCCTNNNNSIVDVLVANGITKQAAQKRTDGRDYLEDFGEDITKDKDNNFCLYVDTTTAWDTNLQPWLYLIKKKYDNRIKVFYKSEEPGNGIYYTNDENWEYFDERYTVDYCIGELFGREYFNDLKSLQGFVKEVFGVKISEMDSLDVIKGRILEHLQKENLSDSEYLNINEFVYDNSYGNVA